jgi:two-component system OmpR family sensor kinase
LKQLFIRFLTPILISIAISSFLVYLVIGFILGSPVDQNAKNQSSAQIFLLEQYVDSAPNDEWLNRLNKVREVSQVKFDLIPLSIAKSRLSKEQIEMLLRGSFIFDPENKSFYRRVDVNGDRYVGSSEDVIYAQNLPIDFWLTFKLELIRYFIVALVVLIPIAFWSRAHWLDVGKLIKVANAFGNGKFSERANLQPSASIYTLAQQMNEMAERIERLVQAQKTLIHSISHELRTPIARLTFGLELLYEFKGDQKTLQKKILAMQNDTEELNELVSELLEMSLLEQANGKSELQLELVETRGFIESIVQQQTLIEHKSIEIFVEKTVEKIYIDQKILRRAIGNIIKNAVKYCRYQINIRVTLVQENRIHFSIDDDGDGINAIDAPKIFNPFFRVDNSRNKVTGGFGLGLSIAQNALNLHHASITYSPSSMGGAHFEVILPMLSLEKEKPLEASSKGFF